MHLRHALIAAGSGFSAVMLTVSILALPARSTASVPASPIGAHAPSAAHGLNGLPTGLLPVLARTLATQSPQIWNAKAAGREALMLRNPAQHFSTLVNPQGMQLELDSHARQRLAIELLGLRSGGCYRPVAGAAPRVTAARVTIPHGQGLTEWYVNSPLGLEQGFTLSHPPAPGDSLTLVLRLHSQLAPKLQGHSLQFRNARGHTLLRYGNLLAYDADGRRLPAQMTLHGDRLELRVGLREARYPVTIDPLLGTVSSLTDPSGNANIRFGASVALTPDGNTALVGVPGFQLGTTSGAGRAVLFTRVNGQWQVTSQFADPNPTANEQFGTSVALSANGQIALIGTFAGCGNCGTTGKGVAFLWQKSSSGWPSSPTSSFSDPGAQSGDLFGEAVALSGDGNTALIGAPYASFNNQAQSGVAFVYTANGGVWASAPQPAAALLSNPVTAGTLLGYGVTLSSDGSLALAGAPGTSIGGNASVGAAYLYARPSGGWSGTPVPSQAFYDPAVRANGNLGFSVAMTPNGTEVLIGDPGTHSGVPGVGAAYLFTQNSNGTWSGVPAASFSDGSGSADDFGISVALSGDGMLALIGAPAANNYAGAVYVFAQANGSWPSTPTLGLADPGGAADDEFASVAVGGCGVGSCITALAGAPGTTVNGQAGAGKVYVLGQTADLSLALASSPANVPINQTVNYLFTVANNDGQVTADNLTLTDTLPAGMSFVSANAAGGSCGYNNGTLSCTLAQLAPQGFWKPSVTVKATAQGKIVNSATVSATQFDPNPADNTASASTFVDVPPVAANGSVSTTAGQAVTGTLSATPGYAGQQLSFAIAGQPAHGTVTLTNASTGAFTYTPATGFSGTDSFTFTASDGILTSNTATETITVTASAGGAGGSGSGSGSGGGGGALDWLSLTVLGLFWLALAGRTNGPGRKLIQRLRSLTMSPKNRICRMAFILLGLGLVWTAPAFGAPKTTTLQPFHAEKQIALGPNDAAVNVYVPIPAGKRLVIQYVSAAGSAPNGQALFFSVLVQLTGEPNLTQTYLPAAQQASGIAETLFVAGSPLREYSDNSLGLRVNRFGAFEGTTATVDMSVSGYLVNIP